MDTILIVAGALFIFAGFLGSFLPVLPGPPISYVGLLLLQFTSNEPFGLQFFVIWALVIAVILILDNVIPSLGAKKYGGTPFGVWGSIIGLVAGFFFPPVGIILGPIAGAFFGEMIGGKTTDQAVRSAWGSFVGFMAGTLLKVIASGMMGWYFFVNI